jgi:glutamine cyclotransferase
VERYFLMSGFDEKSFSTQAFSTQAFSTRSFLIGFLTNATTFIKSHSHVGGSNVYIREKLNTDRVTISQKMKADKTFVESKLDAKKTEIVPNINIGK